MQTKTIGYKALTAIYQPDAVFVERNSKDYSLTREILSRLSHVPVYEIDDLGQLENCLLYTSPSPRDRSLSRMPSSA